MNEARRERIRELIRSLESMPVRGQALCEEDSSFERGSSSSTETRACKIRKMQRIGTTSKAPLVT